jgi:hypothetical protein
LRIRFFLVLFCLFAGAGAALSVSAAGFPSPQVETSDYPVGVLTSKGRVDIEGRIQVTARSKSADPMIYSGNKIYVAEGEARLDLVLGGNIKLCRDSQFTILQGHSPYLFTLNKGSISFELSESRGDTFFTPDFLIQTTVNTADGKPFSFRGELSVDDRGVVCVRSVEGSLRLMTQNNRGILTIPAGASVRLNPGEIKPESIVLNQSCSCQNLSPKEARSLTLSFQHKQGHGLTLFLRKLAHIVTLGLL